MGAMWQMQGEDGFVYFYDTDTEQWRAYKDVGNADRLPDDIKEQIKKRISEANAFIKAVGV